MNQRNTVAVVLGSGLHPDGSASAVTELRAKKAAKFIAKNPMTLIASGARSMDDTHGHGKTEASVMLDIIRAHGVESLCYLEELSIDTLGNAIFSTLLYLKDEEPGTLYVITSPFHMERAKYIFSRVLGHRWRVRGSYAPEWDEETRQLKSDEAFERARTFFADIEAGDLAACLAKLIHEKPYYADIFASLSAHTS